MNSPYDIERRPQPTAEELAEFNAGVKRARNGYASHHPESAPQCHNCGKHTPNRVRGFCRSCAKKFPREES